MQWFNLPLLSSSRYLAAKTLFSVTLKWQFHIGVNKKNSFEANGSKKVCKRSQNLIGVIQIYEYFKALIR